jgi:hypothetical protein
MMQEWFCERCNTIGRIQIKKHADVYGVVYLLAQSHAKASPNCPSLRCAKMRVRAPGCTQAEWDVVTRKAAHTSESKEKVE